MNRYKPVIVVLILACVLFPASCALASDLQARYATITYSNKDDLREFNNELYMGRLKSQVQGSSDTMEQEVISKIDFIVEKVMIVLDMFQPQIKFSIVIHPDEEQVQKDFKRIYNIKVDYIAFYSPSKNTVFYSADNATLRVVAHEIGHVVAENYFTISPPQKIHEVMAQYAEQHITD